MATITLINKVNTISAMVEPGINPVATTARYIGGGVNPSGKCKGSGF